MTISELLERYRAARGGNIGETERGVLDLNQRFTSGAPIKPGYLASTGLRRAYVNYYLPVNA